MATAACLALAATSAQANFTCSGQVSYLGVNSQDMVYVAVTGFGVWAICKLGDTWSGVSPNSCKAWYAGLLAAKRADSGVALYFDSSATGNNGSQCTALGSWSVSPPYHIDL